MATGYLLPILVLPFLRGFSLRTMSVFAMILAAIRVGYLPFVNTVPELYFYGILSGAPNVLFWICYEILYFSTHDTKIHGRHSAWYFAIFSGGGIIMPAVAGILADHVGFVNVFYIAAALLTIPLFLTRKIPNQYIPVTLKAGIAHIKKVSGLMFMEGLTGSIPLGLIGLSLLTFTKTAGEFGVVSSLVALGALFISLPVASWSDKVQSRTKIIYPAFTLAAILLIALGYQTSFLWFTILLLIFSSVRTVTQPIINALPMDLCNDHTKLYMARQFFLGIGRVVGFSLTWFFALTEQLYAMYVIYALTHLIYLLMIQMTMKGRTIAPVATALLTD